MTKENEMTKYGVDEGELDIEKTAGRTHAVANAPTPTAINNTGEPLTVSKSDNRITVPWEPTKANKPK